MHVPEYTLSLLLWIVPIVCCTVFFIHKRVLTPEMIFAMLVTISIWAGIGFAFDLLFAKRFFIFSKNEIIGIYIRKIPIEEFIFYITGFWFIIFVYVFCDEWLLKKYNVSDKKYARYRSRLRRLIFGHVRSLWWAIALLALGYAIKRVMNPSGDAVPGYFFFLVVMAYVPMFLFFRVTKKFVNWRGFFFSLQLTLLISLIWEVTLALPRQYWGFQKGAMMGIFIPVWNDLPIEEITVWICSTLAILFYEYVKICYFTTLPSVPAHKLLLKIGREWRVK